MLNNPIHKTLTAVSGSVSTTFSTHGLCHQILVKPTTSSTGYDLSITDSSSLVIFNRTDEVGTLNDLLTLPLSGIYTVSIDNATIDEAFDVLVVVRNS